VLGANSITSIKQQGVVFAELEFNMSFKLRYLIFVFVLPVMVSCAGYDEEGSDSSSGSGGNSSQSSWIKVPTSAADPATPFRLPVKRVFQNVNWVNCDGTVTESQETVEHPYKSLELVPVTNTEKSIKDSDVFNDTTEDWRECKWNICKKNQFDIHTSNGVSQTMYVRRGRVNEITYKFKFSNGKKESGKRFIFIDYSEEWLEETQTKCNCEAGC
jgi:hypothetical protein